MYNLIKRCDFHKLSIIWSVSIWESKRRMGGGGVGGGEGLQR